MNCPLCNQGDIEIRHEFDIMEPPATVQYLVSCVRCGLFEIRQDERDFFEQIRDQKSPIERTAHGHLVGRLHLISGYVREMSEAGMGPMPLTLQNALLLADAAPKEPLEQSWISFCSPLRT